MDKNVVNTSVNNLICGETSLKIILLFFTQLHEHLSDKTVGGMYVFMHMCVCMCVCVYAHTHVHMYVVMYICALLCMHEYVNMCVLYMM